MNIVKFEFDYWATLKEYMLKTYPDKIIFMYDSRMSFFDAEEIPLEDPILYSFKSIDEFIKWWNRSWDEGGEKIDLLSCLSILWVNGIINQDTIYKLRV